MQRQIIVLFCSLFLWFGIPAQAAEPTAAANIPNRGALFKLEQGGHTAYLFGTIHVGAKDFYPLEPRVTEALQQASVLALEIDPLGDQAAIARAVRDHGMARNGRGAVSEELSPAYRPRLQQLLRRYAISPDTVAPMKPWMVASLLTISEFVALGYDPALAVDAWLSRQARERQVRVMELESVAGQMMLFNRMSNAEQARFLEEGIAAIEDEEQAKQARDIVNAWRQADQEGLDAIARKAEEDDTFSGKFVQHVLLDQRNPGLAAGIASLLARERRSFAAIGVLHLVGKGSVPELLRKRGISVQRIY
ncbi:TraB/GumN family protein [Duganella sp. FT92W]|uniref:TraB/GumN family protein n=1 Tax=Pseudoduganella rivuli TaxID=2666085 RepID=A0A7X2LRE7_9BURK|nr:TraB/GumN family protein [Pseudoduganella rivuli]MRV70743.1 TraB/GumN family protein [Pseudoduganella rivuli]